MPIRPEMRALYPPEWPLISDYIRFDRAMGRCECDGRCGYRPHLAWSSRWFSEDARCPNYHGDASRWTGSKVVLTTMHLDHDPTNCDPDNLLAGCQACHLAYDREHHAATRAANTRERDNQMTLFPEDIPAGENPLPTITIPAFENDGDALRWMGVDAARWTAMFLRAADLANAGPDFVHTVHGWFCNAIGAGQSSVLQVPKADEWFSDALKVETVETGDWLTVNIRDEKSVAAVQYDQAFGKATHAALTKWLYPDGVDMCHNGHPFKPGTNTDNDPPNPAWCDECGEARRVEPNPSYVGTRPGVACPNCKGERYDGKYCLDCGYRPPFATAASSEEGKP